MISKTILSLFPNYRNDEFTYWDNISTLKNIQLKDTEKRLEQISKIRNKRTKEFVLDEFLDTLISELIDNSGCNLIIFNVPETHQNGILVTDEIIHDSFVQYGPIFALHKYNDIAYIWFIYNDDAKMVCDSIDNMECERNILQCQFTKSNLITDNYDWVSKKTYQIYTIKNISLKLNDIDTYWKTIV